VDQNFLREVGEALLLFNNKRGWIVPIYTAYGLRIEECQRPLLKRPAWDGEGLPSTGTICEFKANILGWVEVTITAVTELSIVFTRPSFQNGRPLVEERLPHKAVERFRPIRTPEQIAAEERARGIEAILNDAGVTGSAWTGDPEAESWAAALYDANWRKQVAP
jgi:hypothetical protein